MGMEARCIGMVFDNGDSLQGLLRLSMERLREDGMGFAYRGQAWRLGRGEEHDTRRCLVLSSSSLLFSVL